jgi:membrane-associated phospholipid phosphatase
VGTRHPITASVRRRVVLWGALVAAGTLLALAARGAGPLPGALALTRLLQDLPPDGVAGSLLSRAGDMVWVLLAVAFVVALLGRRRQSALFVMLAGVTGVLVGVALKLPVVRPRPSVELVQVYEPAGGYSFPSATALLAVIALGVICLLIRKRGHRVPSWSRR